MLCRKSDCIFCPLDNMVASGMNIITKIAYQKKKPVFAFDNELLNKGVLATRGIEYRECGKKAADILYKALFENGAYEFSQTGNTKIFINQELWHYYELSETLKEN